MDKLEQYLREKIDYKNKMHDFDLGTETLKVWLDDFKALSQDDVMRSAFKEAFDKWGNTKNDVELGNWLYAKSKGIKI